MQTMSIIAKTDLSFKKYLFAKLLHGLVALILSFLVVKAVVFSKNVFAFNDSYLEYAYLLRPLWTITSFISGIYLFKVNIILLNKNHVCGGIKWLKQLILKISRNYLYVSQ